MHLKSVFDFVQSDEIASISSVHFVIGYFEYVYLRLSCTSQTDFD